MIKVLTMKKLIMETCIIKTFIMVTFNVFIIMRKLLKRSSLLELLQKSSLMKVWMMKKSWW